MELTELDRRLLNALQKDFPTDAQPFRQVAARLGTDEETVLAHLRTLKAAGLIQHLGAFFDARRLGYHTTLIAVQVEQDAVCRVADWINQAREVTHNYERRGKYNLWFTLCTADLFTQTRFLALLAQQDGVREILNLPAQRRMKLKVALELK